MPETTTELPIDANLEQFDSSEAFRISSERAEEILSEVWRITGEIEYLRIEKEVRTGMVPDAHLGHHEEQFIEETGEKATATEVACSYIATVREQYNHHL